MRWQIGQSSADVLLGTDAAAVFEWQWGWRRGLFTPNPAWSVADFGDGTADSRSANAEDVDATGTVLAGWQPSLESLSFIVIPRSVAILVGSLAVLAIGLGTIRVGPGWRVAGLVTLTWVMVGLFMTWPQVVTVILYAAQPGIAVLAAVLFTRWMIRRNYRRRVLFLPSFAQTRSAESSLVRNGPPSRIRREPSTIDAPTSRSSAPAGK